MTQNVATAKNERRRKRKRKENKKELDCITIGTLHISHILNSVQCILQL